MEFDTKPRSVASCRQRRAPPNDDDDDKTH